MIISARCAACALICHSSPAKFPSLSFSFSLSISFSILSPFLFLYLILYSLTLSISLSYSLTPCSAIFFTPLNLSFLFSHNQSLALSLTFSLSPFLSISLPFCTSLPPLFLILSPLFLSPFLPQSLFTNLNCA